MAENPEMDVARSVLELDSLFQPQARKLAVTTKDHNHVQLLKSTYLYTRATLLAERADEHKLSHMVSFRNSCGLSYFVKMEESARKQYLRWRHGLLAVKFERRLNLAERTEEFVSIGFLRYSHQFIVVCRFRRCLFYHRRTRVVLVHPISRIHDKRFVFFLVFIVVVLSLIIARVERNRAL